MFILELSVFSTWPWYLHDIHIHDFCVRCINAKLTRSWMLNWMKSKKTYWLFSLTCPFFFLSPSLSFRASLLFQPKFTLNGCSLSFWLRLLTSLFTFPVISSRFIYPTKTNSLGIPFFLERFATMYLSARFWSTSLVTWETEEEQRSFFPSSCSVFTHTNTRYVLSCTIRVFMISPFPFLFTFALALGDKNNPNFLLLFRLMDVY